MKTGHIFRARLQKKKSHLLMSISLHGTNFFSKKSRHTGPYRQRHRSGGPFHCHPYPWDEVPVTILMHSLTRVSPLPLLQSFPLSDTSWGPCHGNFPLFHVLCRPALNSSYPSILIGHSSCFMG